MLEYLRCEIASMMFVDGQVVTIGTPKGKFLQTHPAIIASFNAYFLYGNCEHNYYTCTIMLANIVIHTIDDLSNQYQSVPTSFHDRPYSPRQN